MTRSPVAAHDGLSGIDKFAHTPILAVTSYAMLGDRERALDAGCTGYMEKPINPKRLPLKSRATWECRAA